MYYSIQKLTPELVYIKWHKTPTMNSAIPAQFIHELKQVLANTEVPMYFISDLRLGRLISIRAVNQLSALTAHENWAGSTAFSQDPLTAVFVNSFLKMSNVKSKNELFEKFEDAIAFLLALKPDIADGVDWEAVLDTPHE